MKSAADRIKQIERQIERERRLAQLDNTHRAERKIGQLEAEIKRLERLK